MSDVKRWDAMSHHMAYESPDGEFVKYEDIARVIAERDEAVDMLNELNAVYAKWQLALGRETSYQAMQSVGAILLRNQPKGEEQ